jgi:hypothetical protein
VLGVEAAPQAWREGAEELGVNGETMDAKREAAAAASPGRTGVWGRRQKEKKGEERKRK